MAQPQINLYIDVISPFGYMAMYMLRHSPTFKDVKIQYTPIVLGGLHKQCNNTAPIFVKNKDKWINKERDRWAEIFKIPVREGAPPGFPVPTVNAMRALVALQMESGVSEEQVGKCVEVLWSALWCPKAKCLEGLSGKGENGEWNLKDPKGLETLIGSVVGGDIARKVVGKIGEKDVKEKLLANTGRAFEKGAFGIPWFECVNGKGEEEGFWGFDHLGQVVRFLGLKDGADKERSGEWLKALL